MSKKVMWMTLLHDFPRPSRMTNIIVGLGLAIVCLLGVGDAAAQTPCTTVATPRFPWPSPDPNVGRFFPQGFQGRLAPINCAYDISDPRNINIYVRNPEISSFEDFLPAIEVRREVGAMGYVDVLRDVVVYVHAYGPASEGPGGDIKPAHPHPLDFSRGIMTSGDGSQYVLGEDSYGVYVKHEGAGRTGIDVRNPSIRTSGSLSYAIYALQQGSFVGNDGSPPRRARGAVIVNVIETDRDRESRVRPLVATRGDNADAIRAQYTNSAAYGHVAVTVEGYTIATGGIVPVTPPAPPERRLPSREEILRDPENYPDAVVRVLQGDPDRIGARDFQLWRHYRTGPILLRPFSADPDVRYAWNGRYMTRIDEAYAAALAACRDMTGAARVVCYQEADQGGGPTGSESRGIYAGHQGLGDVRIRTTDSVIMTWGDDAQGIYGTHTGRTFTVTNEGDMSTEVRTGGGEVSIHVTGGSIITEGEDSYGVWGLNRGNGGVDIDLMDAFIGTTSRAAHGVLGMIRPCLEIFGSRSVAPCRSDILSNLVEGTGVGDIAIDVTGGSIATVGQGAYAVWSRHENEGNIAIRLTGGATARTTGDEAYGVFAEHRGIEGYDAEGDVVSLPGGKGDIAVALEGAFVITEGDGASGVLASRADGMGNVAVTVGQGSTIETMGARANGVSGVQRGSGTLTVGVQGSSITTTGTDAVGVYGLHAGSGNLAIDIQDSSITTTGTATVGVTGFPDARGVLGVHDGSGNLAINVWNSDIATTGTGVTGVQSGSGTLAISVQGGSVTTTGEGSDGIRARILNEAAGDVTVTVGQGSRVVGVRSGVRVTFEESGGTQTTGGTGAGVRSAGLGTVAAVGGAAPTAHGGGHIRIENRGTIVGKIPIEVIGIQAGGRHEVVGDGVIHSTDGPDGTLIYIDPGENMLMLRKGTRIIGRYIQGVTGPDDLPDLRELSPDDVGFLTFLDDHGNPARPANIMLPKGGRCVGATCMPGLDTTAFALTDDMLSDLTGSIHAAVIGNGFQARAGEGDPARRRVWAAPFGGARDQDGADGLADGTHYFGGGMLGAGWGTAMRVGVFVGGSTGRLDVTGKPRAIDMQTVFGGVYARQKLGDVLLDARVLMGKMDHDSTRRVGFDTANVEYTSIFLSPEVGVATRMQLMSRLYATPQLRVRYAGLFTEGFQERGANGVWDARFAKRDVHVLEARSEMGVPISLHAGGRIVPRVGIEGRWLVAGDTFEMVAPDGASFVMDAGGDQIVGTGTMGVGMVLPVVGSTALVGNFDGAYTTEEAWRATGYLGLVYSF